MQVELDTLKENIEEMIIDMSLETEDPFEFISLASKNYNIDENYCKDEVLSQITCSMCMGRTNTNEYGVCHKCVKESIAA